jgi:hypothetical protein
VLIEIQFIELVAVSGKVEILSLVGLCNQAKQTGHFIFESDVVHLRFYALKHRDAEIGRGVELKLLARAEIRIVVGIDITEFAAEFDGMRTQDFGDVVESLVGSGMAFLAVGKAQGSATEVRTLGTLKPGRVKSAPRPKVSTKFPLALAIESARAPLQEKGLVLRLAPKRTSFESVAPKVEVKPTDQDCVLADSPMAPIPPGKESEWNGSGSRNQLKT